MKLVNRKIVDKGFEFESNTVYNFTENINDSLSIINNKNNILDLHVHML